ncbi:putative HicB family RNase H-like nuclease [Bradyrhizobium sp. USDA 4341]
MSGEFEHKGYRGAVFEDGDGHMVAISGIADMITATIQDLAMAQDVFCDLVEDYLATCAEVGKQPCPPPADFR